MATEISARVLKALAPLATKAKQDGRQATMYLHLRPVDDGEEGKTVIEVTNSRHFMRATLPGSVDEALLLHQDDAKRLGGDEVALFSGNRITKPFELDLLADDRPRTGEDKDIVWPEAFAGVHVEGKAAFTIHPKRAAAVLLAFHRLGVQEVEVLLPKKGKNIIGFRGTVNAEEDDRVEVEGGFLPADMFHEVQQEPEASAEPKEE